MQNSSNEVVLAFFAATIVLLFLVGFIIIFAVLFQQRQLRFRKEKELLQQTYEREILLAQSETQEQTLQYVGEELHDNIGQLLTVTMYQLNSLEDDLAETPHQLMIQQSTDLIGTIIQAVRQLSKSLDSQTIHHFGLEESIALELDRIQRVGRFETNLQVTGNPYSLNEQVLTVLFRMVQESINNAIKHSGGKHISITIAYEADRFNLTITDDGQGFTVSEVKNRVLSKSGSGLGNLERRAKLLGGTYQITSQTAKNIGTTVIIQLPRSKTI